MKHEDEIVQMARQLLTMIGSEKILDVTDYGSDAVNLFCALRTFVDRRGK